MRYRGIGSVVIVPVLTLVACVPTDTSETRRDESVLAIPVPSPGLHIRVDRDVWLVLPGMYSVVDQQASVLLKRHSGAGDVFISSPPLVAVGGSAQSYREYIVSLGNLTVSEVVTVDGNVRKVSSFHFEEWRDNVLCVTLVAIVTLVGPFTEKILFRASWPKSDSAVASAVQEVLESIRSP